MYEELVRQLRILSGTDNISTFDEAADAIEKLSKRVPKTPHGRLIDADALHFVKGFEEDDPHDYIRRYAIDNAPTIIQAEEGE